MIFATLKWRSALFLGLAGLVACSSANLISGKSYVVLLPDASGRVGRVWVKGPQGQQVISQAGYGTALNGGSAPASVPESKLKRDFAEAMSAQPEPPEIFVLYFESGGAKLTQQAAAALRTILEQVAKRSAVDVSVTGHSDTVGKAELNEALALKRAQLVAGILIARGLRQDSLNVDSHGESNLLVKTPDETPEPRNRRVEVTIR